MDPQPHVPTPPASPGPTDRNVDSPSAEGRCWGCGYLLRGLREHRCPECGRAFDPDDPETIRWPSSPGWLIRRLVSPITWPMLLAPFAAVLLETLEQRYPPIEMSRTILVVMAIWFVVALDWLIRILARLCVLALGYHRKGLRLTRWRRFLVAPVVFALAVRILAGSDAPMRIAFGLSRSSMEEVAEEVLRSGQPHDSSAVGLYRFLSIEPRGDGVVFLTSLGTYYTSGFLFVPDDPETQSGADERRWTQLAPHWYVWWGPGVHWRRGLIP